MSWIRCRDINGTSGNYKSLQDEKTTLNNNINKLLVNLDLIISDEDYKTLIEECNSFTYTAKIQREISIEKDNRPSNTIYDLNKKKIEYGPMNYNKKALINRTQCIIPEDISIALSFGWKFLFPFNTTDQNMHEILAQLDQCIEESIPVECWMEASKLITNQLLKRDSFQEDPNIQWLSFINKRTSEFLEKHDDILVTRSDKGGHTVIIDVQSYDEAVLQMLSGDEYELMNENPLEFLRDREKKLMNILKNNYKCKKFSKLIHSYQPNILNPPKFYGLFKAQKPGFKLRPIVAMNGSPGYLMGKIFNAMLGEIFPRKNHHVKDSYDIKKFLDEVNIPSDYILQSFDVVSMFSTIPRELAREIIMNAQNSFLELFGIGRIVLNNMIDFLLCESTVFTACGNTYKQIEGLPMGGCISPTLARLVMDRVIDHVNKEVKEISFIKIFVDDTLAVLSPRASSAVLNSLNNFKRGQMSFTVESENEEQSINFLNLTITRCNDKLSTNWYRKPFASGRLLSYFSSHKRTTILGTAETFIKTVISLSDPKFFNENKPKVIDTLRDNCFPDSVIDTLMNKHYTLMKPVNSIKKRNLVTYKMFPYATCKSTNIKKIIYQMKYRNVVLADSTRNTRINHIKTRKTKTHWSKCGNLILISKCNCETKYKIQSTKFNQTGESARKEIITSFNECIGNKHAFRKVQHYRGLMYRSQTNYLVKYIKYFHRNKLVGGNADLPNYHLSRVLKNLKLPKIYE